MRTREQVRERESERKRVCESGSECVCVKERVNEEERESEREREKPVVIALLFTIAFVFHMLSLSKDEFVTGDERRAAVIPLIRILRSTRDTTHFYVARLIYKFDMTCIDSF